MVFYACSPKIIPTAKPAANSPQTAQPVAVQVKPAKKQGPQLATIALILPFDLNNINLNAATATRSSLSKADVAADYYQGFKLALDSLTAQGYNFKLQVFDSKGEGTEGRSLAFNPKVRNADMVVGPVFPETIKAFTAFYNIADKPVVSPLSPAPPAQFKYKNLVTATPPLEAHARKVARYINDDMVPAKVFIIKSGSTEDSKYSIPFQRAIDSLSEHRIKLITFLPAHGNFDALKPMLSANTDNIFIIPSTDQTFLTQTLSGLDKLNQSYPVMVFGHPNWAKAAFLQPEQLQRLKTHITTADKLDYRSARVLAFMDAYRAAYHQEPGEYAWKGFDEGYYFGLMIATGADNFKHLDRHDFEGLRNNFVFAKTDGYGWVNTDVAILRYHNFELVPVP